MENTENPSHCKSPRIIQRPACRICGLINHTVKLKSSFYCYDLKCSKKQLKVGRVSSALKIGGGNHSALVGKIQNHLPWWEGTADKAGGSWSCYTCKGQAETGRDTGWSTRPQGSRQRCTSSSKASLLRAFTSFLNSSPS